MLVLGVIINVLVLGTERRETEVAGRVVAIMLAASIRGWSPALTAYVGDWTRGE